MRRQKETNVRVDLLLRRLILLAGDVHDHLASGEWEDALPVQEEYNEEFAKLLHIVQSKGIDSSIYANELFQLKNIHAENELLAEDLYKHAGEHLKQVRSVQKIGKAYSPLGKNHQPAPRYIDGSA